MPIKKRKARIGGILLILLSLFSILFNTNSAFAASNTPPGPNRYRSTTEDYTIFQWWLIEWGQSDVVCQINIEHEGAPTLGEIYLNCGTDIYTAWAAQAPCSTITLKEDTSQCPGYYLHLAYSTPKEREVTVPLPSPTVWLELEGCSTESTTNRCQSPPVLALNGVEPISGENITYIAGELGGEPFSCDGKNCKLPLPDTGIDGINLTFWGSSSYGDSSQNFNARVRVTPFINEEHDRFWYVDILSSQWRGEARASCAESWDTFPPIGGVPYWLSTPEDISALESDFSYVYLAGKLISHGMVDASKCLNFGLDEFGQITACGLDAAQPAMIKWQNRFDPLIMKASEQTSIPAVLLKRLFARESQFWPGVFNAGGDVGLGQLTVNGADMAFLWNPAFFAGYCPLVYEDGQCQSGYLNLHIEQQEMLREALVNSVNAMRDDTTLDQALMQADFSVSVFANTLLGSCQQTAQVIDNNSSQKASYEDLWKFTLLNYNAGAGCLGLAVNATGQKGDPIDWEHVSQNLTAVCIGAKDYVEDISSRDYSAPH